MIFRARDWLFEFPRPALVMGIVNVTPDSFSDGGRFLDPAAAVEHALQLEAEGAAILDIGGESTRPGAAPVAEEEELRRVLPVIRQLAGRIKIPISVDTQKPAVAQAALDSGAAIVNDIAANRVDDAMWRLVARARAGYIAMHMQGTPQTMQSHPEYDDVVAAVRAFFLERLERLAGAGVAPEQVALDCGLGFGKTVAHNLTLLAQQGQFTSLRRPLVVGASRKSFIGHASGERADQRWAGGLACACWAVAAGARIIRTHDVRQTVEALRMTENIQAAT